MRLRERRHRKKQAAAVAHGRQLLSEARYEENLRFLGGVMEEFDESAEIRLLYGICLLDAQPRAALSEIAKAVEMDPKEPILLARAARIMYDMKQLDRARAYTKRAQEFAPEDFVFGPELLNLESNFAALDGNDEMAEAGLRLAVEREPRMDVLACDLASFLVERGRHEEALDVIDEALKRAKEPKDLVKLREEITGR